MGAGAGVIAGAAGGAASSGVNEIWDLLDEDCETKASWTDWATGTGVGALTGGFLGPIGTLEGPLAKLLEAEINANVGIWPYTVTGD